MGSLLDLAAGAQAWPVVYLYGCNVGLGANAFMAELAKRSGATVIGYTGITYETNDGFVYELKGELRMAYSLDANGHGVVINQNGTTNTTTVI